MFYLSVEQPAFAHPADPVRAFHINMDAVFGQHICGCFVCGDQEFAARAGEFQGEIVIYIVGLFGNREVLQVAFILRWPVLALGSR